MGNCDTFSVYTKLSGLLKKSAKGLEIHDSIIGSKSKQDSDALHLYGKAEVSVAGRKPQKTYVAGIAQLKNSVGFYFMPVYSHPGEFELSEGMKKCMSGKSCFQIRDTERHTLRELEKLLVSGIKLYKKEGWI